ncbi:MAG: glycosyltransferase family 4 protein [Bryobacteraceae bacterium]
MKILFVNRMLGVAWGGGENYDYQLARELQALGHEVAFVTGRAPGQEMPRPGLDVETIAVETPYLRDWMYRLGGKVPLVPGLAAELDLEIFGRRLLGRLTELVKGRRFDVAQVLSLPRVAAELVQRGWRVAMRFPGPPAWFQGPLLTRLARHRGMAMFSHGDAIRQVRERWRIEIDEVPPGIRGELWTPPNPAERERLRNAYGLAGDAFVAVSVGRMVPGKGQEHLIAAMPALIRNEPRAVLVLAGDGPLRPRLEARARSLGAGDRVIFTGQLDTARVAAWLGAADVFCLCSDYENYSNAVLEAMASGLPVVATRVGGFPLQVREGESGLLVAPGDVATLAESLGVLARVPGLRMAMGRRARTFAAGFSWRATAERASAIYGRITEAA